MCAQTDPELWFPTAEAQTGRLAKSLCRTCPWLLECAGYALHYDVTGIWGATNDRERQEMRKQLNIKAQPIGFDALLSLVRESTEARGTMFKVKGESDGAF